MIYGFFCFGGKKVVNEVDCFHLLLVYDFTIYLSRGHIGMSKELTCRVEVCSKSEHHCSEGVAATVEGYSLVNVTVLHPLLDMVIDGGITCRQLEDGFIRILLPIKDFKGFSRQRNIQRLLGLLHEDMDIKRFPVRHLVYLVPSQCAHIAETQAAEAGEDERFLHLFIGTRHIHQVTQFLDGKELWNVDKDGGGFRSGWYQFAAGYHRLKVQYWENYGGEDMQVGLIGEGFEYDNLPSGMLCYE